MQKSIEKVDWWQIFNKFYSFKISEIMTIFLSAFAWGRTHAMQALTNAASPHWSELAWCGFDPRQKTPHWSKLAWRGFDPRQKHLEIFLRIISPLWMEKDESRYHNLRE